MKQLLITIYFSATAAVVFSVNILPVKQFYVTGPIPATTSGIFTPNTSDGFTVASSYLHQDTPDSVEFELILYHNSNLDWASEQWIGTIDGSYIPVNEQQVIYYLLPNDSWNLRIATDGKCYLSLTRGVVPPGNPVILPVKIKYKND